MTMSPDCFPSMRSLQQVPSDQHEWGKFTRHSAFFFSLHCVIHPSVHYSLNLSSCSSVSWICVCFLSLSITRMSIIKLENTGAQAASTLLNNQVLARYWLACLLSRLPLLHILGLWLQIMQLCACTCSAMAWLSSVTHMYPSTSKILTPWV